LRGGSAKVKINFNEKAGGDVLVCHCAGVRDARVLDAIERGSASCEAIAAACGAGARCGGCRPLLEQLLEQLLDQRERRARTSPRDLSADAAPA